MSLRYPKVISPAHLDSNSTALVKAGDNVNVAQSVSGAYTVGLTNVPKTTISSIAATSGSSVLTKDLTSAGFTSVPVISLTPVNTSTTQATFAVITSVTTTTLNIRTFITQNTTVGLLGAVVSPVTSAPNITVHNIEVAP